MRIHRQDSLPEPPPGHADHTELTPADADGLGDFMAGQHVISVLLNELHEATGEPPAAILQRLAMLAEQGWGTPSAG